MLDGDVDYNRFCEVWRNGEKCDGPLRVRETEVTPTRWSIDTECTVCHVRTFSHIDVAAPADEPEKDFCGMELSAHIQPIHPLECPVCKVISRRLRLCRGQLMCDWCVKAEITAQAMRTGVTESDI